MLAKTKISGSKLSREEKKELRIHANNLIEEHCLNCSIKAEIRAKNERDLDRYCTTQCFIGLKLKKIGTTILG